MLLSPPFRYMTLINFSILTAFVRLQDPRHGLPPLTKDWFISIDMVGWNFSPFLERLSWKGSVEQHQVRRSAVSAF